MAASEALISGVSLKEICDVAGWSSPVTFVRYYDLDLDAAPGDPIRCSVEFPRKGNVSGSTFLCPLFDGMKESVRQLRDKLEDFCKEELKKISDRGTFTNIVPSTRNNFLQYSHQLSLDLNTAQKWLRLSEGNTVIKLASRDQSYPDHPDRFDYYRQVLCRESMSGRCYWEIEWKGKYVSISVSYKSINRKGRGKECLFGSNDQSWSLIYSIDKYSFIHNNTETELPVKPIISRTVNEEDHYRVGVYVDHSAGTLSFYSVSGDTMNLIHTVQTTFTQPLYPGFWVYKGSSVKLC
ncbi:tripartite motif-containing protein 16-like protein [Megalobrama amblycephala]|uniref:tripartite motif-containing protein 16-like protein n=1 Tax=Megalobrama amblycephala TaxID=75352 RepID=UPI0020146F7A|nr:tripartite motif-containing protein 16-like protein [Megalobrama amblycephala]